MILAEDFANDFASKIPVVMHAEAQENPSGGPGGWGKQIVSGIEQTFPKGLTAENGATSGDSGKRITEPGGSIGDFSLSPENLSLKNAGNLQRDPRRA